MSIPLISIKKLSERLIYIRRVTGYSQSKLALMAETTQQAIQQAEKGKAQNPRYLARLANKLDIPQEWLALNMMPEEIPARLEGLSEADEKFINSFANMTKEQKKMMRDAAKSIKAKTKSTSKPKTKK